MNGHHKPLFGLNPAPSFSLSLRLFASLAYFLHISWLMEGLIILFCLQMSPKCLGRCPGYKTPTKCIANVWIDSEVSLILKFLHCFVNFVFHLVVSFSSRCACLQAHGWMCVFRYVHVCILVSESKRQTLVLFVEPQPPFLWGFGSLISWNSP